jgi:hypothetical protein
MLMFCRLHIFATFASAAVAFTGCGGRHEPGHAPYAPLALVEAIYGPLITAGNHPTQDQKGTGDRVGLFQDTSGAVWGLPLIGLTAARFWRARHQRFTTAR